VEQIANQDFQRKKEYKDKLREQIKDIKDEILKEVHNKTEGIIQIIKEQEQRDNGFKGSLEEKMKALEGMKTEESQPETYSKYIDIEKQQEAFGPQKND
jgi:hypothetical protein